VRWLPGKQKEKMKECFNETERYMKEKEKEER